jgi:CRISPR-associated protein Cas1
MKKRLWQSVIKAKIHQQARILEKLGRDPHPLPLLENEVKSGDPDNIEAQASRYYWPALFGTAFRRNTEVGGVNLLLNYGYSLLHAVVARAVVSAGLHPALGLHHHNQYNAFALASDLVEPLRPLVDAKVVSLAKNKENLVLGKDEKRGLLEILSTEVIIEGRNLPLLTAMHSYCADIVRVMEGEKKNPTIPALP